jgi:hypothetical protein
MSDYVRESMLRAAAEVQAELRAAEEPDVPMSEATYQACRQSILDMMARPVQPGIGFEEYRAKRDAKFRAMETPVDDNSQALSSKIAENAEDIRELRRAYRKLLDK